MAVQGDGLSGHDMLLRMRGFGSDLSTAVPHSRHNSDRYLAADARRLALTTVKLWRRTHLLASLSLLNKLAVVTTDVSAQPDFLPPLQV